MPRRSRNVVSARRLGADASVVATSFPVHLVFKERTRRGRPHAPFGAGTGPRRALPDLTPMRSAPSSPGSPRRPACRHGPGNGSRGAHRTTPGGWRRRDSNPRPPGCKPGALPAELRPRVRAPPMVGLTGLEPETSRLSGGRSNQLSYSPEYSPGSARGPRSWRGEVGWKKGRPSSLCELPMLYTDLLARRLADRV